MHSRTIWPAATALLLTTAACGGTGAPPSRPWGLLSPSNIVTSDTLCLNADALRPVAQWLLRGIVSLDIDRAYFHDDATGCRPVWNLASMRTENDHLRWQHTPDGLLVSFDIDTFHCGRTQVDIDVDGHTLLGVVLTYAHDCLPPPPETCATNPKLCPPPPCLPSSRTCEPPAPPQCGRDC